MPNHISNRISFKSFDEENGWEQEEKAFEDAQALMKTDGSLFDFNVLLPYPAHFKAADDAYFEARKQPDFNWATAPKDGYNSGGYEWCCENWGTKWNAYDIGFDYEAILFNTAWSTPKPIFAELSKRFPELQLEVEYADEDIGSNCGKLTYLNGELIAFVDMSKRPEADYFARAIRGEQSAAENWQEVVQLREKLKSFTEQAAPSQEQPHD